MKYNLVVCGGTFDHLHAGHSSFLRFILSISQEVVIGLTSDEYVRSFKNTQNVSSFAVRKKMLEDFFLKEHAEQRIHIHTIDDLYGPAINATIPLQAIVVTPETINGADLINKARRKKGLYELSIVIAPMKKNGQGGIISSTLIREGKIDPIGKSYVHAEWKEYTHTLPDTMRSVFQKPFGELLSQEIQTIDMQMGKIITVGDVTTRKFLQQGYIPKVSIIDFVIEREKVDTTLQNMGFSGKEEIIKISNNAGSISPSLWKALENIYAEISSDKNFIIVIDGEEDLAVIPLILEFPLGYTIFYGQPSQGLVKVVITPDIKQTVYDLFMQFAPEHY